MINLADERDVREEQHGAGEVQRFGGLEIFLPHFAQVIAARVRAQQERETDGDFHELGNLLPVGGDQQNHPARHQHRADGRDDREEAAALLFQTEVRDDALALLIGDQTGCVDFLQVSEFHVDGR